MMKSTKSLTTFAVTMVAFASARAEILPSFGHAHLARQSDHVVLATEGDSIDGKLTVLATYKGNLAMGSEISVPSLRVFAKPERRKIQPKLGQAASRHAEVSCRLMILFLKGKENDLQPTSFPDWYTWLCWIEDGEVYAYWQEVNPGGTELKEYARELGATLTSMLREISVVVNSDGP